VVSRLGAIIEKPRTFYIAADLTAVLTLGSPGFTPDGKVVGVMVYRIQPMGRRESAMDMMSGMGRGGMTPGLLPAADVLEVAKQALAAPDKPAEKKDAPPAGGEKKEEKKKK
jgi:hypothetical protein